MTRLVFGKHESLTYFRKNLNRWISRKIASINHDRLAYFNLKLLIHYFTLPMIDSKGNIWWQINKLKNQWILNSRSNNTWPSKMTLQTWARTKGRNQSMRKTNSMLESHSRILRLSSELGVTEPPKVQPSRRKSWPMTGTTAGT